MKMSSMKFVWGAAVSAAVLLGASGLRADEVVDGFKVGPITISCKEARGWTVATERGEGAESVEELVVRWSSPTNDLPPSFRVTWDVPQVDIQHRWWMAEKGSEFDLPPEWRSTETTDIAHGLPVMTLFNESEMNRLTFATDESVQKLKFGAGVYEEACTVRCFFEYFSETRGTPCKEYVARVRLDGRAIEWGQAIREATEWVRERNGTGIANVPREAFRPLYSTWYGFHQNVTDKELEEECARAAELGMGTLIVDDGWHTDDTNKTYAVCGDWMISTRRFPNVREHVKKVQAMGMKYMLWYTVAFVGKRSEAYQKFAGKWLYETNEMGIPDVRYPEVREYLIECFVRAVKDWEVDGLKLDFVDCLGAWSDAPGETGRDYWSVEAAIERFVADATKALRAVKPDVLIEFRQKYVGTRMQQFGNMIRVVDCAGDATANRVGIAQLRLITMKAAVHSDMIEWHVDDTAENGARMILNSMFGVVQYSMRIDRLPKDHLEMMRHWIRFSREHESALLHGEFRAHYPEMKFPILEAWDARERIVGVYARDLVVDVGTVDKCTYVLNVTNAKKLTIRCAEKVPRVIVFDTFGKKVGEVELAAGLNEVAVPSAGYIKCAR